MINKIIIDGKPAELNESSPMPYTHLFQEAKIHNVKFGLDNTDEICAYAFKDCVDLTKIEIPECITMLKREAFKNCEKLPEITLGSNIKYIGSGCFDGCTSLKEIKFERTTPPSTYCQIPEQTTCYIPNGSKYVEQDIETMDTSGDINYYTRTDWNQYEPVVDLTVLDENEKYYRNQWDSVCENYKIKEEKDRNPVTKFVFANGSTISGRVNQTNHYAYIITPEDYTNTNLTWIADNYYVTSDNTVAYYFTYNSYENNVIDITFLKENTMGSASLTCYTDTGLRTNLKILIYGDN